MVVSLIFAGTGIAATALAMFRLNRAAKRLQNLEAESHDQEKDPTA
jgi:hypothetical protein